MTKIDSHGLYIGGRLNLLFKSERFDSVNLLITGSDGGDNFFLYKGRISILRICSAKSGSMSLLGKNIASEMSLSRWKEPFPFDRRSTLEMNIKP